jgi:uncharacterized protein (UPF0333 family)
MNIFSLAILGRGVGGMPFQPRDNRGQALLEFALVLPVLLLLVFGIIEFGLIFFDNLDDYGFMAGNGNSVQTSKQGVFIAGVCQGPKDIPQTVGHAKAAAGEAYRFLCG